MRSSACVELSCCELLAPRCPASLSTTPAAGGKEGAAGAQDPLPGLGIARRKQPQRPAGWGGGGTEGGDYH